jgi:CRP-like cAMP-binding protein
MEDRTERVTAVSVIALDRDLFQHPGGDSGGMWLGAHERRFRKGQHILLEPHVVLQVRKGIIAVHATSKNGAEILLGFCSPRQVLVGAAGTHAIMPIAQTDAVAVMMPWKTAVQQPDFHDRLRERLYQVEAWVAMQGHGHLDQRLHGVLALLAQQFGVPADQHVMIDLRVTHTQLAAAIGATRETVTRLLSQLRKRGVVKMIGSGSTERLCLRNV